MNLDDINLDFDLNQLFESIKDSFFKIVRIIFMMFFNLPTKVKIILAVFFVLFVIGIGYLTWRYRNEWQYVKY